MVSDEQWMAVAVSAAREGIHLGQSPFGAIVVRGDRLVSREHNTVWLDTNPTAHAEINALKKAALELQAVNLKDCVVYSTCEPCPMCLSAIHWANARRVVFGATICDAAQAGFRELAIDATQIAHMGGSKLEISRLTNPLACVNLFTEWQSFGQARTY